MRAKMSLYCDIFASVAQRRPLVHCITNYVTANDCANILLACGASPIMADSPSEAEEITAASQALVLNLGTFNESRFQAMRKSAGTAERLGLPIIIDPVGVGASQIRREAFARLAQEVKISVVRGNVSEINSLALNASKRGGVDAEEADFKGETVLTAASRNAMCLGKKLGCTVVMTGVADIITDGANVANVKNGVSMMSQITGSGCMLSSLIGAFCGAHLDSCFDAAVSAAAMFGLCGEEALKITKVQKGGTGTFRTCLIDAVSLMKKKEFERGISVELQR